MPTSRISATARSRAACLESLSTRVVDLYIDSAICQPTFIVGFSERVGSWNIREDVRVAWARHALERSALTSTPPRRTVPEISNFLGFNRFNIARQVIDFPAPDSPTNARACPGSNEKETPSTSVKGCALRILITRFSTSTIG